MPVLVFRAMRIGMIGMVLALLIASCGAVEPGADRSVDRRAAYDKARQSVASHKEGAPGLSVALDHAWSAVADWTAGYLDEHPDATAEQLAKAVEALDPPRACTDNCLSLRASAVRLNETTFAVAANYPRSGTFFVIVRDDGHFRPKWNIKDIARQRYASRDEIGYWAWTGGGWGDGPPTGSIGPLPPSASGRARFYVDAVAAAKAGGTFRKQFSVWEWDGAVARPLFIESYQASFDTEPVTVSAGTVRIPMKGSYKSFSTCGACPEPRMLRTLRVAGDGVHDLGTVDNQPELRCADDLWDRLIHGQDGGNLAAPEVVAGLRPVVEEVKRGAGTRLDESLGMLEDSKLTEENGHRQLLVSADALDCKQLRFEVRASPRERCLRAVRVIDTCGDQTGSAIKR